MVLVTMRLKLTILGLTLLIFSSMNIYSRALRHISIKNVKQKHQEKVVEKIQEEVRKKEERQYIQSVMETKKYDWRKELNEQMTTSDVFFTNLPATGDLNLEIINSGNQQSFNPNFTYGVNFGSDGFDLGQNYLQFSGEPDEYGNRIAGAFAIDTSQYTNITFNAVAGNSSNTGTTPSTDLGVYWFSSTTGGLLGVIPKNSNSLSQYSFTLPKEAMGKEIEIFFTEENPPEQYQQYVGKNVPSVHPSIFGVFSAIRANELLIDYPNFDINNSALTSRIFAFWDTLQEIYTGASWPNANGYPAPVSGQKGTLTGFTVINGEPVVDGGDYKAIYNALYNRFGSGVNKYPLTYGIGNLGFRRTTPINVFVSLDSPEASSFIRTDPMMSNLSPAERQKKLREMLASGNEYVKKMLGADFPGTGAVPPGEYDPFKQAPAGKAGDTPGVELTTYSGGLTTGGKVTGLTAISKSSVPSTPPKTQLTTYQGGLTTGGKVTGTSPISKSSVPSTPPKTQSAPQKFTPQQLNNIDKQIKDLQRQSEKSKQDAINNQWRAAGELALGVAGLVGGVGALAKIPAAIKTAQTVSQVRQATKAYDTYKALKAVRDAAATKKMVSPGKYTATPRPGGTVPKGSGMYMNSYEPQGQLISEKKLKSPEEVLNKIPGYYDGKPAPLGFPETPPPEMVNGMHPDLVDGKKTADRFNRLDPQSAKAMPLTGNPHIDKKVKAATKKPK
jgi:hypothetical protein